MTNSEFLQSVMLEVALQRAGKVKEAKEQIEHRYHLVERAQKKAREKITSPSPTGEAIRPGKNAAISALRNKYWL